MNAAVNLPQETRPSRKLAVVAASLGNMLEWYDFTVFALFAPYIAASFFPGGDPTADLVKTFLTFGLGFVARPLGAVVLGVYGDRAGRRSALTVTILTMAAGTGLIAVAPGYRSIGSAAPLLLLAGRLLQGFSAGGEIGGAAAFLVESAPAGQRGLFASWLEASMGLSNILGALMGVAVTGALGAAAVRDWGWRIPFFVGLLIAPVGLALRRTLHETPEFEAERERRRREGAVRLPLAAVFADHARSLAAGTGLCIFWAVSTYVLIVFAPVYAQRAFHFAPSQAFTASLVANVLFVASCFGAGALADRVGQRATLAIGAGALLAVMPALFAWLSSSPTLTVLIVMQSLLCVLVAGFVAAAPATLAALFPASVRSTGMSLTYNAAFTVFGGFAPAILTWLTRAGGSVSAPVWYVGAAALIALAALAFSAPASNRGYTAPSRRSPEAAPASPE